ncbi:MAG TPA: BatD family protein [Rhodocyclaceae bacterium]|nr:BatD family protein [Rhodocyclaceae bacterium]
MVRKYAKAILALLGAALLLLGPTLAQATLQATVDRNPVAVGESFTLSLQSDGSSADPDLAPLGRDFEVLGRSQGSSFQMINGRISRSTQWQISLAAKHEGQIVIPAISAGGESSQPITLKVTAASQGATDQAGSNLFVEMTAEPRTAYVQQQVVVTVRLYSAVDLGRGGSLNDPVFPGMDAVVQRLGEDRQTQTVRNGKEYLVIERRYLVYPQKDGSFTSEPVIFNGSVIEAGRGGGIFDPFGQRERRARAASKPLALTIKPAPASFANAQWLPASKLQLSEQWSQNPPKFTVGEPVTRTLTLQARGLTSSALPAIDVESSDALKLYPDQPALKDNKDDNGNTGVREQKFAFIPTRPGKLTLPAIEVRWWNTTTDKEEIARLPAREISIAPAPAGATPQIPAGVSAPSAENFPSTPPRQTATRPALPSANWWPWISLALGLGWLITLIAWWRARGRITTPSAPRPEKQKTPKARVVTPGQQEELLKNSCVANDAAQARVHLLAWARQRWPDNPPDTLTALTRLCEPVLAKAVIELDRHLYANITGTWHGERLWDLFQQQQAATGPTPTASDSVLEPLYKS